MKRVVYTVATGKRQMAEMAMGLGRSLALIGDDTPRAVYTDIEGYDWDRYFQYVIKPVRPRDGLEKLLALELTDADQVLALDSDMLAFKRLGPIFDWCAGKELCVQGIWIKGGQWHGGPVEPAMQKYGVDRIPKFNGGLIYYERTPGVQKVFRDMETARDNYDEHGFDRFREKRVSEEVCLLIAMLQNPIWTLIPDEYDFQNTGTGLVGKLNLDVITNECHYMCRQHSLRYCEPYVFHAHFHRNYLKYWKQLDKLEWLANYEKQHGHGYMSPMQKFRRSVERRILKYVWKKL